MLTPAVLTKRWTREEYERLVAAGVFHPEERLELLDGEIIQMPPQGSAHATAVRLAEEALRTLFSTGCDIRVQMPLALDPASEPEPDVAAVIGGPRDYREAHPQTAVLVVEVADSTVQTVQYDREHKARVYAHAGIPEYWIVNLVDQVLEVYRDPAPVSQQEAQYQDRRSLNPAEMVSPLARATQSVSVRNLLP